MTDCVVLWRTTIQQAELYVVNAIAIRIQMSMCVRKCRMLYELYDEGNVVMNDHVEGVLEELADQE